MNKIFIDANDKYVAAAIVYGKAADSKLYANSALDEPLDADEVADAFKKGVLKIVVGDDTYVPVAFEDDKYVTIGVDTSTATPTQWTVAVGE